MGSLNTEPFTLVPEYLAAKTELCSFTLPLFASLQPHSISKGDFSSFWPRAASTVSNTPGASEIAQQVKALAIKSDDLHLTPSTKKMEGESRFYQVISELHMHTVTHTLTHTHTVTHTLTHRQTRKM